MPDRARIFHFIIVSALSLVLVSAFANGASIVHAAAPIVQTLAPTNVTATSADLQGTIDPGSQTTSWWFVNPDTVGAYCPRPAGTLQPSYALVGYPTAVSCTATGLTPSTTYKVHLFASNHDGNTVGNVVTFTTLAGQSTSTSSTSLTTVTSTTSITDTTQKTTTTKQFSTTKVQTNVVTVTGSQTPTESGTPGSLVSLFTQNPLITGVLILVAVVSVIGILGVRTRKPPSHQPPPPRPTWTTPPPGERRPPPPIARTRQPPTEGPHGIRQLSTTPEVPPPVRPLATQQPPTAKQPPMYTERAPPPERPPTPPYKTSEIPPQPPPGRQAIPPMARQPPPRIIPPPPPPAPASLLPPPGRKTSPPTPVTPLQPLTQPPIDEKKKKSEKRITFPTEVLRREDFLYLSFEFINLQLQPGSQIADATLVPTAQPAYMIVYFQPQNIAEEAFFQKVKEFPVSAEFRPKKNDDIDAKTVDESPKLGQNSRTRISGPSRLVFKVSKPILYTLPDLLDWAQYEPSLLPVAEQPPPPVITTAFAPPSYIEAQQMKVYPTSQPMQYVPQQTAKESATDLKAYQPLGQSQPSQYSQKQAAYQVTKPEDSSSYVFVNPDLLRPEIKEPTQYDTAIEAPYRLVVSPHKNGGWAHSRNSVSSNLDKSRFELWHTRLGVADHIKGAVDEADSYNRTIRAVWSPDYTPSGSANHFDPSKPGVTVPGFRMSLDPADRNEIVNLSSGFKITNPADDNNYNPKEISVERLMLSALGAWMNVRGAWDPPNYTTPPFTVEEWRHRATMARDNYVRVVYKGYLFPFGHRASLIKITERKFCGTPTATAAYLRQRMYIIVREPEKAYSSLGYKHARREMPFTRVRITTTTTPDLNDPANSSAYSNLKQDAFWPKVGLSPKGDFFSFHLVAEDSNGQHCEFMAPLIFVSAKYAYLDDYMGKIAQNYQTYDSSNKPIWPVKCEFGGQKIAFAESRKDSPGDTTLETDSVYFGAEIPNDEYYDQLGGSMADQPRFLPTFSKADVRIPAVKHLLGSDAATTIEFEDTYLTSGFSQGSNSCEVFAKVADNPPTIKFPGDKSGGVVTPNISVVGLSRLIGPIGGKVSQNPGIDQSSLDTFTQGTFDPEQFFPDEAKILGGIPLKKILETVTDLGDMPKLSTVNLPDEIRTTYQWETTRLQPDDLTVFQPWGSSKLSVKATLSKKTDPKADPTYEITGSLTDFSMRLIPVPDIAPNGFIIVPFNSLTFTAKKNQKLDVNADIGQIQFDGPLRFVQELTELIPSDGFRDPPSLEVTAEGVKAGYTLAIPNVAVGAMSLENLSFSAGLHIPFTGEPVRLRLAFCERHHPFHLTVSLFGGGGFLAVGLGLDRVELLEAAFEFGGNLSLDLGVASGGVCVMAGIYFKWEDKPPEQVSLTGYLRCNGAVEVLEIVCVNVEFYMGLTYDVSNNRVWGEATLTVEVDVAFFSKSVDLTVRREFVDPVTYTVAKLFSSSQWDDYWASFA